MRALLLNDRWDPDETVDGWLAWCREVEDFHTVVASRDDFLERAKNLGGWPAWVSDITSGYDAWGNPRFDAFILYNDTVGTGNQRAVALALKAGRDVWYVDEHDEFQAVVDLERIKAVNGKARWRLVLE